MPEFPVINWITNRIHAWGQPQPNSLKKTGLTRLGGVACVAIETLSLAINSSIWVGVQFPCCLIKGPVKLVAKIKPELETLKKLDSWLPDYKIIEKNFIRIVKIVVGLASTILFGIFISPEINFRMHIKLGLSIDKLSIIKEKQLRDKLEWEAKAAAIRRERAERFAKFESEIEDERSANKDEDDRISSELAARRVLKE